MNLRKRILAYLLTFAMVLSLAPQTAHAANVSNTEDAHVHVHDEHAVANATATAEAKKASSDGSTVLAFTSDTHNKSGNAAAIRLGTWIDKVESKHGDIDVMAFGGDMANASASTSDYWTLTAADIEKVDAKVGAGVYTTGNHEYSPGSFSASSSDSTQKAFTINAEGKEGDDYRIYCFGSVSSSQSYSTQISSLESYLNSVGNDKPIFIITHFPLHYKSTQRTTSGASDVIDVLNSAVDRGQTIVFLWGHNHTDSDSYYDQIYGPGTQLQCTSSSSSKKEIKFYYGAAGCMSDSEYGGGSAYVKGKGLVVTITKNRGNATMAFAYYNESGADVTESASVKSVDVTVKSTSTYSLTETLEAGKEYLIVSGNSGDVLLLSNESTGTARQLKGISANVSSDGKITIDDTTAEAALFTSVANSNSAQNGIWLKNGDQYLYADSNDGLRLVVSNTQTSSSNNAKSWHYKADGKNLLWFFKDTSSQDGYTDTSSTYKYYLDYTSNEYFTDKYASTTSLSNTNTSGYEIYLFEKVTEQIPVTGVSIQETSASVAQGRTITLHAVVEPTNANNYTVSWSSEDTSIATVEANTGKVKGIAEGTTTITVTVTDNTNRAVYTASIDVTVTEATTQYFVIMIDNYALTSYVSSEMMSISQGYEYHGLQTLTYNTSTAAPYYILWTLEEASGVENGYYIKNYNGKYLSATYSKEGNQNGYTGRLIVGNTQDVWVVTADGGLETWQGNGSYLKSTNASDNPRNSDIYLTTRASNNSIDFFTVGSSSNYKTSKLIEPSEILEPVAVTGITVDPVSLEIEAGKTSTITANVVPSNADDKTVEWTSSDETVATVDANGKVKGKAAGTATISATTNDGHYTATCEVTVTPSSAPGIGYVITIGNWALSTEPSSDQLVNSGNGNQRYYYNGLLGVEYSSSTPKTEDILWLIEPTDGGYYIMSQDGRYLNATYVENETGGSTGTLKLDDTPDVWTFDGTLEDWVLSGSTLHSTNANKYLTHEEGSTSAPLNLFTIRSTGESSYMIDPDTPAEVRFVETNSFTTGRDYIVAVTKDGSSVYAIANANGSSSGNTSSVTIGNNAYFAASGNEAAYIVTNDTTVVWNYTSNKYLSNSNRYLSRSTSGTIVPRTSATGRAVTYDSSNKRLSISYSGTYYLTNSNGTFGFNTSTSSAAQVRLFEKQTVFNFKYVVQFVSNGVNYQSSKYASGETPVYSGTTPTRAETDLYTYEFAGWSSDGGTTVYGPDEALPAVTGPVTYVAQFTAIPKPTHEHTYGEPVFNWVEIKDENDVVTGYTCDTATFTCTDANCDHSEGYIFDVDVTLTHETTTDPGCETTGVETYTATCSYQEEGYTASQTVTLTALGHDWDYENIIWNWDGFTCATATLTCTRDSSHTTDVPVTVTSETVGNITIYTASFTADGTTYTDTKEETLHTHIYGDPVYVWAADNSTCTATVTCTGCAEETEGHTVTETGTAYYAVTVEPSCSAVGEGTYTATFTNTTYFSAQTQTVSIEKTAHTVVKDEAVAPTCTQTGLTEGSHCSVCNEVIVAQETVNALGHDLEAHEAHGATCTEVGNSAYWNCKREGCGKFFSDAAGENEVAIDSWVIPAAGHTEETIPAVAATCTDTGLTEGTKCSVCGTILVAQSETPALGHDYGTPSYTWAGDNSTVTASRVCSRDESHVETETVGTEATTTDATCTVAGTTTYTATFTNTAFEQQTKTVTGEALGHELTHTAAKAATCTEAGNIEYWYCSRCEKYFSDEACETEVTQAQTIIAIDPDAHSWKTGENDIIWDDTQNTATFVCANNEEHTSVVAATVEYNQICQGCYDRILKVTFNGTEYTHLVHYHSLGSKYGYYTFTQPWSDPTSLPTEPGNYYLTVDVTLSETWVVSNTSDQNWLMICMNGHTISLDSGKIGSVIKIPAFQYLKLHDCGDGMITGGNAEEGGGVWLQGQADLWCHISGNAAEEGGGVFVKEGGGLLIMNGSTISNNTATSGGGVCVKGLAGIDECTIENNSAADGGGVYVTSGGTVSNTGSGPVIRNNTATGKGGGIYMNNGAGMSPTMILTITGNTARYGGGICIDTYTGGTVEIAATIENNTAELGGGVYADYPFYVFGGSITGNTATENGAGVYVASNGEITLGADYYSGNSVIVTDNTVSGQANNVYLSAGKTVKIANAVNAVSFDLGITTETVPTCSAPVVITTNYANLGTAELFHSDAGYSVRINDDGEAELYSAHTWSDPVWSWAEDYSSASASFTCSGCDEEQSVETTEVTSAPGTGDHLGYTAYTATVTLDGEDYSDTVYKLDTYSVSFVLNDGIWPEGTTVPEAYTVTSEAITLPTPEKAFYTFDGWFADEAFGGEAVATIPSGSTGNKTFYAKWTAVEGYYLIGEIAGDSTSGWTVVNEAYAFVPNGSNAGEYILQTSLAEGDKIKVVRAVGGEIQNWYPEGMGNEYTVEADYAGDVTVYFKPSGDSNWGHFGGFIYIAKDHTITVTVPDGHGTAAADYTTASKETTVTLTATPDTGYEFDHVEFIKTNGGEAVTIDFNATDNTFPMPDYDVTVKVYFKLTSHTVTFVDAIDDTVISTATVEHGSMAAAPTSDPTHEGWAFVGWSSSDNANTPFDFENTTITADTTVYAIWQKTVKIMRLTEDLGTIKVNDNPIDAGSSSDFEIVVINSYYAIETIKIEYVSAPGWYLDSWIVKIGGTFSSKLDNPLILAIGELTAETEIHRFVEAIGYKIHFDSNGGTGSMTDQTDLVYGTSYTLKENGFTREGYTFAGWNTAANGTGTPYANGATVSNLTTVDGATVTFFAQWTPITYTVTWVIDGVDEDTSYDYGTIPSHVAPEKASTAQYSYTFTGWSNGTTTYPSGTALPAVTADVTYTAQFSETLNKYSVTFVDENGTVLKEAVEYDYGTLPADIVKPADPTKEATAQYTFTFAGWTPEIVAVTANATYTATYSSMVNKYSVTFVDEDGTTVLKEAALYDYGTPAADIVKPADPTKEATAEYTYSFAGWSPAIADVTGNATYQATYTATKNKYTVTFVDEDGTTVLKEAVAYDYGTAWADVVKPDDPTKTGYTFAGWTGAPATVTENVTVKASYTINSYTITWVIDGVSTEETYNYGEMPAHEAPVKAADKDYSYTFEGWTPEIAAVTGPATYTANFSSTPRTYGEPVWSWADDYSSATAAFTTNDGYESFTQEVKDNELTENLVTAETCLTDRVVTYTASVTFGGKTYSETSENVTIAGTATGHAWGAVEYSWAADYSTCTATRICANDQSHKETQTVETTSDVITPATETEAGTIRYTAEFTNPAFGTKTEDVAIPPTGYAITYEWTEIFAEDGTTVIGYSAVRGIATPYNTAAETITEDAVLNPEITTEPTCTAKGVTTYTAAFTNEKFSTQVKTLENVAALGHAEETIPAVAATCTKTGLTAGVKCSRCGEILVAQEVVQALGHDYEAVVTAPTCEAQGYTTHTCSRCGDSYKDSYTSALGHDYEAVVTAPTCEAQGYTTHTCSRCGDSYTDTYTNALGHDWDDGVITKAATCTETGVMTFTCRRDASHTKTETIPATGHAWPEEPTCVWADDFSSVTATFVCGNDASHTESVTVSGDAITSVDNPEATATTPGTRIYTAVIPFEGKNYTVTTSETIPAAGVTVTGAITSFVSNTAEGEVEIVLLNSEGTGDALYTAVVTDNTSYSFSKVALGTYTLQVSKKDHVTRTYVITLNAETAPDGVFTQDVKIHLLGDINGDGKITTIDAARTYWQTTGVRQLNAYELLCADANGDGEITTVDVGMINSHARQENLIW